MPESLKKKLESKQNGLTQNSLQEVEQAEQNKFIREKIKERPINNNKLIRRSIITAAMAVIFGLIACITSLVLEPIISKWLYPEEKPQIVVFPEDPEEMSPEEMLSGNLDGNLMGSNPNLENSELEALSSKITLKKEHAAQIYKDISDYVMELDASMVTINAVSSNVDWFSSVEESSNQTKGLIIADNGREILILTIYEPIKKAQDLILTFENGLEAEASLKGQDIATDLAVLAVDRSLLPEEFLKNELKIANFGSSNLSVLLGTPVVALGSPMGSNGSLGYGMVCYRSGQQTEMDMEYKLLQTDIVGSSKATGFLFNMQGQVIGVITNDKTATDMKNAVTAYGITELKPRIAKISNGEKFAYLGVTGVDVTEEANKELGIPKGAYITELKMDSPAMLIGIHQGDVIVKLKDKEIRSFKEYVNGLSDCDANETVEVTVMRQAQSGYKELKFSVILGEE